MDRLIEFRNPELVDDRSDIPHPLAFESDEAIGRRYNRGTGAILEGGPFTSFSIVSPIEASHMYSMRENGERSRSAKPSRPSGLSASTNAGLQNQRTTSTNCTRSNCRWFSYAGDGEIMFATYTINLILISPGMCSGSINRRSICWWNLSTASFPNFT